MSALQAQALQYMKYIPELSDDKLLVLIDTLRSLIAPMNSTLKNTSALEKKPRRLGSLKGQKLLSDGYDIDECNDEIEKMFGATDQ